MPEPTPRPETRGRTYEELQALRLELEDDIRSIRKQIQRAQVAVRATGQYASQQWWLKVHEALRIKGHQCQEVQQEMGRLTRARKAAKAQAVEARFVEVARKRLPEELFRALMDEALKVA